MSCSMEDWVWLGAGLERESCQKGLGSRRGEGDGERITYAAALA